MIRIGICDDNEREKQYLYSLCQEYFDENGIERGYMLFSSGEELLAYCDDEQAERLDLLFLDIELNGINGIETKERILKRTQVWRIVFVSSYKERVWEAFGLKTLGFIIKPANKDEVKKWINIVLEEMKADVLIPIEEKTGEQKNYVRLDDILYFKACGNYTEIFLQCSGGCSERRILVCKKLGELEKELLQHAIVRVHKSYMVNLAHITELGEEIELCNSEKKIPVGRFYKAETRERYVKYERDKVRRRL